MKRLCVQVEEIGVFTQSEVEAEVFTCHIGLLQKLGYRRFCDIGLSLFEVCDEIREGVEYPDDVKMQIVERAWGSPIWHEVK